MALRSAASRKVVRAVSGFLVIAGLAAFAYLWLADWCAQQRADANISRLESCYEGGDDGLAAELRHQAQLYNAALSGERADAPALPYERQLAYLDEPMMGYVQIPKIAVRLPIYHGVDDAVLMNGVGHLEGSSLPVGGAGTHCVLLGHSGMANTRMLDDLDKLACGDKFIVWALGSPCAYEVFDIETVAPEEVAGRIGIRAGADMVTLVTCTPYGVNSHRLLVHARRCEYVSDELAKDGPAIYVGARGTPLVLGACALAAAGLASVAGFAARELGRMRKKACNSALAMPGGVATFERNGNYETWKVRYSGSEVARPQGGHGPRHGRGAHARRRFRRPGRRAVR